jgi:hypothetical protein
VTHGQYIDFSHKINFDLSEGKMLIAVGKVPGNISLDGTEWRNISKIACFLTIIFLVIFLFKPAYVTAGEETFKYVSKAKFTSSTENTQNNANEPAVNSAGFISPAVTPEVILDSEKIDKSDVVFGGLMAWNPISYDFDYWAVRLTNEATGKTYLGDINGNGRYSRESNGNMFAASLAAIAAFQGYHFLKTQIWAPEWLKSEFLDLKISPQPMSGFVMRFEYRF